MKEYIDDVQNETYNDYNDGGYSSRKQQRDRITSVGHPLYVKRDNVSAETFGERSPIIVTYGKNSSLNTNSDNSPIVVLHPFNAGTTHGLGSRGASVADNVLLKSEQAFSHLIGAGNYDKLITKQEKSHSLNAGKKCYAEVSGKDSIAGNFGYGGICIGYHPTNALVQMWQDPISHRPRVAIAYIGEFHKESGIMIEIGIPYVVDQYSGKWKKFERQDFYSEESLEEQNNRSVENFARDVEDSKFNKEGNNLSPKFNKESIKNSILRNRNYSRN